MNRLLKSFSIGGLFSRCFKAHKTTKSLTEIKEYMDAELYPQVRKELEKDSKTHLSKLIKGYNELSEKKSKKTN